MRFLKLEKQILWHLVLKTIRTSELGKIKRVRSQSIMDKDAEKVRHLSIVLFERKTEKSQSIICSDVWIWNLVFQFFCKRLFFKNLQFRFWRSKIRFLFFSTRTINLFALLPSENFQRRMAHVWENEEKSCMKRRMA